MDNQVWSSTTTTTALPFIETTTVGPNVGRAPMSWNEQNRQILLGRGRGEGSFQGGSQWMTNPPETTTTTTTALPFVETNAEQFPVRMGNLPQQQQQQQWSSQSSNQRFIESSTVAPNVGRAPMSWNEQNRQILLGRGRGEGSFQGGSQWMTNPPETTTTTTTTALPFVETNAEQFPVRMGNLPQQQQWSSQSSNQRFIESTTVGPNVGRAPMSWNEQNRQILLGRGRGEGSFQGGSQWMTNPPETTTTTTTAVPFVETNAEQFPGRTENLPQQSIWSSKPF